MKKSTGIKTLGIALVTLGLTVGCAGGEKPANGGKEPMAKESSAKEMNSAVSEAIAAAEVAIGKAKAQKWIWRDTEKFLKKAKKMAKEGKDDEAIKLANKAHWQAKMAIQQHDKEKSMDRSVKP